MSSHIDIPCAFCLFFVTYIISLYMCTIRFNHFFIDGHLGYLQTVLLWYGYPYVCEFVEVFLWVWS